MLTIVAIYVAIKHPAFTVTVYQPEITSMNPTTNQDTYTMTIKAFQTTYGPLRYNLATQIQPVLDAWRHCMPINSICICKLIHT